MRSSLVGTGGNLRETSSVDLLEDDRLSILGRKHTAVFCHQEIPDCRKQREQVSHTGRFTMVNVRCAVCCVTAEIFSALIPTKSEGCNLT